MQRRLARAQLLAVHQHEVKRHSCGDPAICERGGPAATKADLNSTCVASGNVPSRGVIAEAAR